MVKYFVVKYITILVLRFQVATVKALKCVIRYHKQSHLVQVSCGDALDKAVEEICWLRPVGPVYGRAGLSQPRTCRQLQPLQR